MELFNYLYEYLHLGLYSSLFILILIEEAGLPLPVPGDAFLVIFGVLSRSGQTEFLPTLLIITAATAIGSTILYAISYRFGRPLAEKYGHYIHLTPSMLNRMERWMGKYGWLAIFLTRMVPTLRIGGSVVAGILKVPYTTFIISTIISTWIWATVYFFIGAFLGKRYGPFLTSLLDNHFFFLGLFIFFIVIGILVFKVILPIAERSHQHYKQTKKAKAENQD